MGVEDVILLHFRGKEIDANLGVVLWLNLKLRRAGFKGINVWRRGDHKEHSQYYFRLWIMRLTEYTKREVKSTRSRPKKSVSLGEW